MNVSFKIYNGYVYGFSQLSVLVSFEKATAFSEQLERSFQNLARVFEKQQNDNFLFFDDTNMDTQKRHCEMLLASLRHVCAMCGDLQLEPGYFYEDGKKLNFAIPTLSPTLVVENLKLLSQLLPLLESGSSVDLETRIQAQVHKLSKLLPLGTNTGNLIKACVELKQPFSIFQGQYLIVGYGKYSKIFNSTISEDESATGMLIAKSKVTTRNLLSLSGFPVTKQILVKNIEEVEKAVEILGYPVVLKEENGDKGIGIHANILNQRELLGCCAECSFGQKRYVVESHVAGNVYRINTIAGKVVRCVKRTNPRLIGDGKHSVSHLLNIYNSDTARNSHHNVAEQIVVDFDMNRMLSQQGMTLNSIPEKGQIVQIRSGTEGAGKTTDVLQDMCDENKSLFEQVARTLSLDVTGIDFITEDISVPWSKSDCAICEVNAQPQLGNSHPEIYKNYIHNKVNKHAYVKVTIGQFNSLYTNQYNKVLDNVTVKTSAEYVLENGLPVSQYNEIEITPDVDTTMRLKLYRLLKISCSS